MSNEDEDVEEGCPRERRLVQVQMRLVSSENSKEQSGWGDADRVRAAMGADCKVPTGYAEAFRFYSE